MNARQLALDFAPRPALGAEDFLVTPCHAEAVAWIDRFPDWPGPALLVVGAAGSGKTHLARVFAAKSGAAVIDVDRLAADPAPMFPDAPAAVIDDAERVAGIAAAEEALFHLFNQARERGARMLLSATARAPRWGLALADLESRLAAETVAEIGAPDDALLTALLAKMFADRQIVIDADVLGYVVPRMERSFAAARRFVADADRRALESKRRITVPLARAVLSG